MELEAAASGACTAISGMAFETGAEGPGARSCTATRLARCGEASMTVLSQAPAAKVKTRPMAMATDFRFMFLVRASATPSEPVQSGSACLMQKDMQVLRLREYKQTYRAVLIAPPGNACRFRSGPAAAIPRRRHANQAR